MTQLEQRLAEEVLREIQGIKPQEIAHRLIESGLINRRICEQRAIRHEVERQQRAGIARCEAFLVAATLFCCSYEKVRGLFYATYKH